MGITGSANNINIVPKYYYNTQIDDYKVVISGFIRRYKQWNGIHDHHFIFDMIFSFYYQGCAKYIDLKDSKRIDQITSIEHRFGDIVELPPLPAIMYAGWSRVDYMRKQLFIVNKNNNKDDMIEINTDSQVISIPLSITSELDNTLQFYAKVMRNGDVYCTGKTHQWCFTLSPDDGYIIYRFGDKLNSDYVQHITVSFTKNELQSFSVKFKDIGFRSFDFKEYKYDGFMYTNKDIEEYYQCRMRSKMIGLSVSYEFSRHVSYYSTRLYSVRWERRGGSSGQAVSGGPIIVTADYIGPFDEKDGMIDIITKIHSPHHDNFQIEQNVMDNYMTSMSQ